MSTVITHRWVTIPNSLKKWEFITTNLLRQYYKGEGYTDNEINEALKTGGTSELIKNCFDEELNDYLSTIYVNATGGEFNNV